MTIEGVDYAFSKPSPAALVAAGKHFACRYGGPGSDGKQLTAGELAALSAAGIAVVANAEGTEDGLKGGYSTGRAWALDADAYFRALGMPADRPIYLSADWDATSSWMDEIDAAMDGAASVLGRARVGVYGGYDVIAHLAANGKAKWFWQTYAWSEGFWHPAAHIRQYRNGVTIGGADCDLNRAMVTDYGQWTGVDMLTNAERDTQIATDARARTLMFDDDYADFTLSSGEKRHEANKAKAARKALEATVTQMAADIAMLKDRPAVVAGPVDAAALKAVLIDPEVLTAIAGAVLDEQHRRDAE